MIKYLRQWATWKLDNPRAYARLVVGCFLDGFLFGLCVVMAILSLLYLLE